MSDTAFKIVNSGTPATGVGLDSRNDDGPAEPATPQSQDDNTPLAEATPGNGETPATPAASAETPKDPLPGTTNTPASEPPAKETPAPPTLDDLLKAQGFDDDFVVLAKQYKADGNISRYVQAASTDYGKMSPEQILRIDLQRQYPAATQDQLEILYETEVKDKYKLDPDQFDPETKEAKAAAVMMKLKADNLRTQFAKENEAYKLPSRDLQAEIQQQQQAQLQQAQDRNQAFLNHEFSKSVLADKKIVIKGLGPGIPDFNYDLADPNEVAGIVTDGKVYAKYLTDDKGNLDPVAALEVGTFMRDRKAYNIALINYGKSLGREELIEEKHNPPKPGTPASPARESLAEAFAARGKNGKGG